MRSTKRKAQNVYDKVEWHRRLDEKDKVLAKDVFELWMAGLIDLELCIRIEQAVYSHRASDSQKACSYQHHLVTKPHNRQNDL